jgi:hypothetical protein
MMLSLNVRQAIVVIEDSAMDGITPGFLWLSTRLWASEQFQPRHENWIIHSSLYKTIENLLKTSARISLYWNRFWRELRNENHHTTSNLDWL